MRIAGIVQAILGETEVLCLEQLEIAVLWHASNIFCAACCMLTTYDVNESDYVRLQTYLS